MEIDMKCVFETSHRRPRIGFKIWVQAQARDTRAASRHEARQPAPHGRSWPRPHWVCSIPMGLAQCSSFQAGADSPEGHICNHKATVTRRWAQ